MTIESPCIKVCQLDATSRLCKGCLRTADEIQRWPIASDVEKKAILDAVEKRAATRRDSTPNR